MADLRAADEFFPISYWCGPTAEETTRERFTEVAGCGFTLVLDLESHSAGPARARQVLDHCAAVGLPVIVADARLNPSRPDAGSAAILDAVVATYAGHPALYGYHVTDEPHADLFPALAAIVAGLRERDPGRLPYINLYPNYALAHQLGFAFYEDHVRAFVQQVRPGVLSYDHYSLLEDGERPQYFANLETVRAIATEAGIPFWQIVLATPHYSYRDPSEDDLRWQAMTTLTYGAKGLLYFTYWTPNEDNYRLGPIERDGSRTAKYEAVRRVNRHTQVLGRALLDLTSTAVYHWPDAPEGCRTLPLEGSTLVRGAAAAGALVLGEFRGRDGSDRWLMVTNRDMHRSVQATVRLRAAAGEGSADGAVLAEIDPVAGTERPVACEPHAAGVTCSLWLAPGGARLLHLPGFEGSR
jgi:hypothetical protein